MASEVRCPVLREFMESGSLIFLSVNGSWLLLASLAQKSGSESCLWAQVLRGVSEGISDDSPS
jgi:hypothetical protein